MDKSIQSMTYEECIDALDHVISQLEENTLSLQEAVTLFEQGNEFYKQAHDCLKEAEMQVNFIAQKELSEEAKESLLENAVQDTMFDEYQNE